MECIHTNRKLSEERSPLISWYYWNQMLHIYVHHLVVLRHKLWMKSLFSPGGRSRKLHKCYYMSRLIKYDWNLFTFRFGAAYFFILNLPKDFWTSYRIPAENIFFKYKNVNSYVINFSLFPNINYFHEWVQLSKCQFSSVSRPKTICHSVCVDQSSIATSLTFPAGSGPVGKTREVKIGSSVWRNG